MGKLRLYGQRMLNPFHGVTNVIEIDGADALTRDGREWILYLQGESTEERLADGTNCVIQTPDIKFGTWSESAGLRRAPVRQVVDYEELEERGQRLLDTVRRYAPKVPFTLLDHFELWLLDEHSRHPLALLESACKPPEETEDPFQWRPGQASLSGFHSDRLAALESRDGRETSPPHGERLAQSINQAAGRPPAVQWFQRRPEDGIGIGMGGHNVPEHLWQRELPADLFPPLHIATKWAEKVDIVLAQDYLSWQAPWLLQLQSITPETRDHLELAAADRPLLTAQMHRLYPEVQNSRLMRKILVEARFRMSDTSTSPISDSCNDLSPDYIELWTPGD